MTTLSKAVFVAYPNVVTVSSEGTFASLLAHDANGNVVALDETIIQAYIDANAYKEKRSQAYPSVVDQLDLLYHGGYDTWKSAIQTVKERFPK
jgi:hypothetical protein